MNNKLILILAILGVLVLGAIALTFALTASSYGVILNQGVLSGDMQAAEYSSGLIYQSGTACNPTDNYPCFQYQELEQQRLEPCPAARPVCPLCREGLQQTQGEGHSEDLVQVKVIC